MPSFNPNRFSVFATLVVVLSAGLSSLNGVDFEKDVVPVLEAKCLGCHNPNILKGDFSMTTKEDILAVGDDILIPGDAEGSMLYWITVPFEGDPPEMPEDGEALTEAEASLLAEWINEGAEWPEGLVLKEASKADKSWWAYQPLKESSKYSIDEYIEAGLKENGLVMNAEADRRTLIRRATYDLIGLPPMPEEVNRFVNDSDPEAYEKLIDRLLASKHYGERWGRHWLDIVRFGESVGYEQNWIIDDLWPFRDYVIRSLNEDKPFDLLIREHIAGDIIGKGDPDIEIGSAFLVAGPYDSVNNQDAAQAAQIRANTLDEIINATGEAFLGMTLTCARCHDHKFDPISQADYYQLYATFAGVRHGVVPWASQEAKQERAQTLKPLNQAKDAVEDELSSLNQTIFQRSLKNLAAFESQWSRPHANRTGTEERFSPIEAKFIRLICEAQDMDPDSNVNWRIDEFEVWSSEDKPLNVALASSGGVAHGKGREIEDFPNAYGPQHTNDGKFDQRFISMDDRFTIELAEPTLIDRITFSSARIEDDPTIFKFAFVADYRIETSVDGEFWTEVANGRDRRPVPKMPSNPSSFIQRVFRDHMEVRLIDLGKSEVESARIAGLNSEISRLNREIKNVPALPKAWMGTRNKKDSAGPFHVFIGGSPQKQGVTVQPASISTLSEVTPGFKLETETDEANRRVALAEWITSSDNPLTPRVLVNRLWHYHFGTGIVDTPNDFGYMGGRPTHPELLDYLANTLKENNWQLKELHKEIMTSKVYRQTSDWREDGAALDADSRLLWRFPPRRLSAEEIRDTILAVSGNLDTSMGGEGFRLYYYMRDNVSTYEPLDQHSDETYRRAVYHQNARASVVDLMTDFDQADCTLSTPRRVLTTTPLQALTMMNHSFTMDMAVDLADRASSMGQTPEAQIEGLYEIVYQRAPRSEEVSQLKQLVADHGLRSLSRAILNSSELIYLD
ncbi:DUF1553 domain-containing protein [Opitutia bacterium ISCC 51]|nr:DUF1553 domain-containing protein [Opitutae bacterium ISCC 51]QXD29914.1 DUF1553 domain-containing protein [Opitutae bacterium ISCC 52]